MWWGGGVVLATALGLGLETVGLVPLVGGGAFGGTSRFLFRKLYRYAMDGLLCVLNVSVISDWRSGGGSSIAGDSAASGLLSDPAGPSELIVPT